MEGEPLNDPDGQQEPDIVITELEELLISDELTSLSSQPIEQLRSLRDRLGDIEAGLSFGRRMAQGRLDIVMAEAQSRSHGGSATASELLSRLPDVLSSQSRSGSQPRPRREVELPPFADEILDDLEGLLSSTELAVLGALDDISLERAADRISGYERRISLKRHEVHRLIDEIQEEIIGRYRNGSVSVDDLLRD